MLIGLVGVPNKGKSTLFSALTMNEVAIADYPFTTIKPNLGVAYATKKCVHQELGVKCTPRIGLCVNGTRMFPINLIDIAGLVEGAHEGKGMGNQFLNDVSTADAIIIVADASGKTDANGNKTADANPINDVKIVNNEMVEWLVGIIEKHMAQISRRTDGIDALFEILASVRATKEEIEKAVSVSALPTSKASWDKEAVRRFSRELLNISKPYIIAANKSDAAGSAKNVTILEKEFPGKTIACSGAMELALRKAAKTGVINYVPGSSSFEWIDKNPSPERLNALNRMEEFLKKNGTNVQELLNRATFGLLDNIVVYPVEDENKYTDHFGNVLPDGILIKKGSTALNLAERIHTNIAKGMLYAVDARTKKRLSKEYVLQDNDVIKIVSAAK